MDSETQLKLMVCQSLLSLSKLVSGCSPEAKDSPPADTATDTATGTPDAPDVPDAPDAPDADPMPQPEASDEAKKKEPIALQLAQQLVSSGS